MGRNGHTNPASGRSGCRGHVHVAPNHRLTTGPRWPSSVSARGLAGVRTCVWEAGLSASHSAPKSVVTHDSKQVTANSPSSCMKQTPTCIAQIGVETRRSHSKHQAAHVAKAYGARTRERRLLPLLQDPPGFSLRLCSADQLLLPSSTFSGSSLPCLCCGFSVTQF